MNKHYLVDSRKSNNTGNVATGKDTWLHTLISYIVLEHPNNNSNQLQTLMMTVGQCLH